MPRFKKLPPAVELRPTGCIRVRPDSVHYFKNMKERQAAQSMEVNLNIGGKGSKWIRTVYIPALRKDMRYKEGQICTYKRVIKTLQTKCNDIIRGLKRENQKKLNAELRRQRRIFNEEVDRVASEKKDNEFKRDLSDTIRKNNFNLVVALPHLLSVCIMCGVSVQMLCVLLLLNTYGRMSVSDMIKVGYTDKVVRGVIKTLLKYELIEEFGDHFKFYVISLHGKELCKFFYEKYTKITRERKRWKI